MASEQLQDSSDEETPRRKAFYRWCCCYKDHQKTSKKAKKNRDKQDKHICSETAKKHAEKQEILRLQKFLETHKTNMMKKVERIFEGKKENEALLKDVYTELFITEGDIKDVNQEHEIMKIDDAFKNKKTQDKPIKCNDIFTLLRENNEEKIALTKGVTGIGKTVSVHKFILDWAEGKANQDIHCVFLLPFREINSIKDREFNLHEFLLKFYPELKDLEKSELYKECKLVFIFDGLDESRLPLNFKSGTLNNVEERSSVDVLFTSLVKGKLLPSALVWVTSRPAAAHQIPSEYVGLFTEVRGFTDQQKEDYFRKRITDETQAFRIISHIKTSRSLYIMCHIPVFCWITATVLQNILIKNNAENISTTLTEMYIHFLLIQMNMKSQKYEEQEERQRTKLLDSNREMILKLAKLAFEQLKEENIVFYEKDLNACGINVSKDTKFTGIIAEIFKQEDGLHKEKVFCFVHLSVQEFLAAVHVFVCYLNKNKQELQFFFDKPIENITLQELLEKAVDKAMKSKRGHLDMFLRFLMGNSLGSSQNLLKGLITHTEDTTESIKQTTEYIKRKLFSNTSDEASVNLFYCLFELKDHSLYEEIQRYLSSDEHPGRKLSSSMCTVLIYILLMSEKVLDEFNPKRFTSSSNYKRLVPAVRCCRKALLHSQFSALWSKEKENSEAFIMATTDQLLRRFFCWIEEKEHFADNLRKLAEELESLRKKCNASECVGTTLAVLGGAGMIGAGVATVLTGGLAAPLMATATASIGTTISIGTKIIEDFLSCHTMKKMQDIEKKSNEIAKEIQQLFQTLKSEQEEVNPLAEADELEHHIMAEFLRAIARQSGVNVQIINDSVINDILNHTPQKFPLEKISDVHSRRPGGCSSSAWVGRQSEGPSGDYIGTSDTESNPQMKETCLENMRVNSLAVSGVVILSAVLITFQQNRKSIIKLSDTVLKTLSSAGFQTTLIGGLTVVGGIGVMARALPEMIDNWKEMISGNHVTKASQSLRNTAYGIQNTTQKMKQQIKKIKKMLQEIEQELELQEEIEQELELQEIEQELELQEEIEQELELQEIKQELYKHRFKQERQKRKKSYLRCLLLQCLLKLKEQEESSEEETEDPPAVNVGLLNVQSIRNMGGKRIEIKNLITEQNRDVFLMTETWLKNADADAALREASPPNFQFHYECRDTDTWGGGVAIQFSEELKKSERIPFDSITITTFEYVATALKHDKWDKGILCINVYHPPIKNKKNKRVTSTGKTQNSDQSPTRKEQFEKFVDEIKKLLNEADKKRYNSIIVAGDFNVPEKKTSKWQMKSFKDAFNTCGFEQHVKKPTHKSGNTLDLVFSRNVEVCNVKINRDEYKDLKNYNSDHDNNSKKDLYISDHSTVYFRIRPLKSSS